MLKLALIGYGKMGQLVEEVAQTRGHQVISKIDPKEKYQTITEKALDGVDVCIDFSHPESVLENIQCASILGKNLVVGTTGWYEQISQAKKIISTHDVGLIYSPNFSLGVHLFLKIVAHAAALINSHVQYDVAGYEAHHRQKLDAPSGTALSILDVLLKEMTRKEKEEITFSSLRCGHIPGTHAVLFDSLVDTIELKHTARNRQGFAYGAVVAAEWIDQKKGFYSLEALF